MNNLRDYPSARVIIITVDERGYAVQDFILALRDSWGRFNGATVRLQPGERVDAITGWMGPGLLHVGKKQKDTEETWSRGKGLALEVAGGSGGRTRGC